MVEEKEEQQLPSLCKNSKCCGRYSLFAENNGEMFLMPLQKVDVKTELRGSLATQYVELKYINPSESDPLECVYTFPLEKTSVLAKFEVSIENRIIETKIQVKQLAQERYDDAIASGKAAVLATQKKKDEMMTVRLGNLLPGQSATLKSTILSHLEVVGGYYCFALPAAFYPDYKKHGVANKNAFNYEFSYEVQISGNSKISNLSIPAHAEIVSQNDERTEILIRSEKAGRNVDLYYRTYDMMVPQLQYSRSPDSDDVAVQVSLVPTFDPMQPQDFFEVVENEKPEQAKLSNGSDYHFIFIVDRSGSMQVQDRMSLAIDALTIFMRSLPVGSKFSIISFGSSYESMQFKFEKIISYFDQSKDSAVNEIQNFSPNFGGTNIMEPLKFAQYEL